MMSIMKKNPFATMPALSNMYVAGYFSTATMTLPTGVNMPKPFQALRDMKKGFCFKGDVKKPLGKFMAKCKKDIVCGLLLKVLSKGSLSMGSCFQPGKFSLHINVVNIKMG